MQHQIGPAAVQRKYRILLVEDHPVTREGFARLLDFEPDLQVCGQVGAAHEAVAAVESLHPDLVIVDISLAGTSGIELTKDLVTRHPALPVLVFSTYDETLYAERVVRAGAKGYAMKSEPTEQILTAIRQVLHGKLYLSQRMNERLVDKFARGASANPASDVDLLSDRELEIFQLIGQGRTTAQIVVALNISPSTVATHRVHIMEKLCLDNLAALGCRAAQWVQIHN
jgi:DNA-binding NarL/FixJ family response regulator